MEIGVSGLLGENVLHPAIEVRENDSVPVIAQPLLEGVEIALDHPNKLNPVACTSAQVSADSILEACLQCRNLHTNYFVCFECTVYIVCTHCKNILFLIDFGRFNSYDRN